MDDRWSVVGVTVVDGLWLVAGRWAVLLYYAIARVVIQPEISPTIPTCIKMQVTNSVVKIYIWYKRCIIKLLQFRTKLFDRKIKSSHFCD